MCLSFSGGDDIRLIGVDIHKKYCLGVIERNSIATKEKFPNTGEGWKGFLKDE